MFCLVSQFRFQNVHRNAEFVVVIINLLIMGLILFHLHLVINIPTGVASNTDSIIMQNIYTFQVVNYKFKTLNGLRIIQ